MRKLVITKYRLRRIVRLWDRGNSSLTDIAEAVGISVDTVTEYLAQQPGYPGLINPKRVRCVICGADFETSHAQRQHCSPECIAESRRRSFWRCMRRRRGLPADGDPPPRRQWRGKTQQSASDARIRREARAEARERGITPAAVLAEWKFVPQRSSSP
jgi:hypothetical protein